MTCSITWDSYPTRHTIMISLDKLYIPWLAYDGIISKHFHSIRNAVVSNASCCKIPINEHTLWTKRTVPCEFANLTRKRWRKTHFLWIITVLSRAAVKCCVARESQRWLLGPADIRETNESWVTVCILLTCITDQPFRDHQTRILIQTSFSSFYTWRLCKTRGLTKKSLFYSKSILPQSLTIYRESGDYETHS
jgi:hypothetical protein